MASLTHVCMWSDHGWKRITAEQAARYIQAELYLLAAGFLCANSADNTLRLLMATLMYAISNIVRMKKVKIVLNVHLGPDTLPLIARKSTICQSA